MNASSQRVARFRHRQALGLGCVVIEVDLATTAKKLERAGLLEPWSEDDRTKLARAIERLIDMLEEHLP